MGRRYVWKKGIDSKMKPRFLAEDVGVIGCAADKERDGLIIVGVC